MIGTPANIGTASASTGPSISVTVPAAGVPSGVTIFVAVAIRDQSGVADPSCADDASNTYVRDVFSDGTTNIAVFRASLVSPLSSGQSITVSGLGEDADDSLAVTAFHVKGLHPFDPVIASEVNNTSATTSPSTADITSTEPAFWLGALCVAGDHEDEYTFTQDADYSTNVDPAHQPGVSGVGRNIHIGDRIEAGALTDNYAPTLSAERFCDISVTAYRSYAGALSQQGMRQASFRAYTGATSGSYNENLIAASEQLTSVTGRHVNEAEILMLQSLLSSTNSDLNGLRAEYAASVGASDWDSVGVIAFP